MAHSSCSRTRRLLCGFCSSARLRPPQSCPCRLQAHAGQRLAPGYLCTALLHELLCKDITSQRA